MVADSRQPSVSHSRRARGHRLWTLLVAGCVIAACGCGARSTPNASKPEASKTEPPATPDAVSQKNNRRQKQAPKRRGSNRPTGTTTEAQKNAPATQPLTRPLTQPSAPSAARQAPAAQPILRPADTRPPRDDQRLQELGFVKVVGPKLILYSDLPIERVRRLPDIVAQQVSLMEDFFGPLPPSRTGQPYQMTGYLMDDIELFRSTGILVEGPAQPHEGWYLGNEFWWNRQATEYYTRHLMLHEAAHCFMHVMPAVDCPPWYVEGMAELFGTHRQDEQGRYWFGTLPQSPDEAPGWGRVSVLEREIREGKLRTLDEVLAFQFHDYAQIGPYAWSWALCHFLNNHPRYQKPFRDVARHLYDGGFQTVWTEAFAPYLADLRDEWLLFASEIQYGHDVARSVIQFEAGKALEPQGTHACQITATTGWQSSLVQVERGKTYQISATGQFTLATTPRPWISEPDGVSIRYFNGQPLGRLLAVIRDETAQDSADRSILEVVPIGSRHTFVARRTGTLYLRLNDAWNQLADNSGEVTVTIQHAKPD